MVSDIQTLSLQHAYYLLKLRFLSISLGFFPFSLEIVGDIQTLSLQHVHYLLKLRLLSISLEFFPFFVWRSWVRVHVHPLESLKPKDFSFKFLMLWPLLSGQLGQTVHTAWYQWHLSLLEETSLNLLISYVKPFKEVTVSRGTLTRCMGMTSYGIGRLSCF